MDKFHHSLPNSSSTNDDELLQAIYVGCTCVSKHQDVSDIVHKTLLESKPSQTLHVCIKLELSHIEFTDATAKSVLLIQATSSLQSLGVYGQEEGTYLGYIAGDPVKGPLTGKLGIPFILFNVNFNYTNIPIIFYNTLGKGSNDHK